MTEECWEAGTVQFCAYVWKELTFDYCVKEERICWGKICEESLQAAPAPVL